MESDNNNVSMCRNVLLTERLNLLNLGTSAKVQKEKTEQRENGEVKNAPLTEEPVKSQNVVKMPTLDQFVAVDCEMVFVGKKKDKR